MNKKNKQTKLLVTNIINWIWIKYFISLRVWPHGLAQGGSCYPWNKLCHHNNNPKSDLPQRFITQLQFMQYVISVSNLTFTDHEKSQCRDIRCRPWRHSLMAWLFFLHAILFILIELLKLWVGLPSDCMGYFIILQLPLSELVCVWPEMDWCLIQGVFCNRTS